MDLHQTNTERKQTNGYHKKEESGKNLNNKSDKIASLISQLLEILNPNASEEIKNKTPKRYADAILELTKGYMEKPSDVISEGIFDNEGFNQLIVIKEINFSSICEHHLLPFFGECSIGYIPNKKILGLSKFPRLVNSVSSKFHIQERLTKEIAEELDKFLEPQGIIVLISSIHSCMCFRGIKSSNAKTDSLYAMGILKNKENMDQFFQLVKK